MFRIFRAEFKKLFLKPSIFVLAGILIFVLASCSFLYKPNNRAYTLVSLSDATTVSDFYNKINFSSYEDYITRAKNYIQNYKTAVDAKADLKNVFAENGDYMTKYSSYISTVPLLSGDQNDTTTKRKDKVKECRENLYSAIESIKSKYQQYVQNIDNDSEKMFFLITKQLDLKIKKLFDDYKAEFDSYDEKFKKAEELPTAGTTETGTIETAEATNKKLNDEFVNVINEFDFKNKLLKLFDQLIEFIPNAEYVNSLDAYVEKTETRLGLISGETNEFTYNEEKGLHKEIDAFVKRIKGIPAENNDKTNLTKIQKMVTQYKQSCENLLNLVTNGIKLSGLEKYENMELSMFTGLDNFNYYEQKEEQTKLLYLFKTNTFEFDYATPFSMDQPSNFNINAFDFSYYAIRICLFIIIIYVITISASTIVGEQASGTLKMLAIRPYKRSKLLGGKLLATLIIGVVLILVSAITTLAIGGIIYGFTSAPILVIFNATNACTMSPILMYLIMIVTLIVEMSFFVLLALAISMLFKSQVASVAISLMLYFGTIVLNVLLGSASWLKYFPFTNINLYKYFGSSFLGHDANFLKAIFSSPVAVGSSFWFSAIYTAIVMIGLTITVFEVFKRRDIR